MAGTAPSSDCQHLVINTSSTDHRTVIAASYAGDVRISGGTEEARRTLDTTGGRPMKTQIASAPPTAAGGPHILVLGQGEKDVTLVRQALSSLDAQIDWVPDEAAWSRLAARPAHAPPAGGGGARRAAGLTAARTALGAAPPPSARPTRTLAAPVLTARGVLGARAAQAPHPPAATATTTVSASATTATRATT